MTKKILLFAFLLIFIATVSWGIEVVRQKNAATYIVFPLVDADGDFVESAAGLDSEIDTWADGSAPDGFTDCTNEATEIGGGVYYLSLSQSEMNYDYIVVKCSTTTSGAKKQMILIRTIDGDPLKVATVTSNYTIDVASTGEVGIDLDNINGTLDAAEIGGDAITAAKIADDAIDYATFAATAPTSWWNEGKTGYVATLQSDTLKTLMDSLGNIRNYTHAVQETVNAHAPHGNNWATAGSGDTTEMKTMMQNNWDSDTDGLLSVEAGAGGADTSDIKAMVQNNWDKDTDGFFSIEPTDVWQHDISAYGCSDGDCYYAGRYLRVVYDNHFTSAQKDSVLNAIDDANKPNFKATGFATSTQGDSITNAITAVNKANFKSDGDTNTNPFNASTDSVMHTTSIPVYVTGTPDVNVAQISGSSDAADNTELAFDGDSTTLAPNFSLRQLWIDASDMSNESHAIYGLASPSGYGAYLSGGGGTAGHGLYLLGNGTGAYGLYSYSSEAAGGGAHFQGGGSGIKANATKDIDLINSGQIHGTIDSLLQIRNYAYAVQETLNAHAPHGDNFATAGSGDTTEIRTMMRNNWDTDTDGLLSVEAGAGGADTSDIKTMMTNNWDDDTDGLLSVENPVDSVTVDKSNLWLVGVTTTNDVNVATASILTIADQCSTKNQAMIQRNWDTDDDALLAVENPTDSVTIDNSNAWDLRGFSAEDHDTLFNIRDYVYAVQETINAHAPHGDNWATAGSGDTSDIKTMMQNNWDSDTDGEFSVEAGAGGADTTQIKTMIANNWDTDDDAQLAAELSGTGVYGVNIDIKKTTDSSVVPQYHVSVTDSSTDLFINEKTTNSSGRTEWALDAGTYAVTGNLVGWGDLTTEYLTVSANVTDTYYVAQTALGASDPTRCNCYCYTYDLTSYKSGCKLTATIPKMYGTVTTSSVVLTPFEVSATSNDTGYVNLEVPRSSEMTSSTGSTVKVFFELTHPGSASPIADTLLEIPDSSSHKIW